MPLSAEKERIRKDVDAILHGKMSRYESLLILPSTPQKLLSLGLRNLPILMSQGHVKNCLTPKGENPKFHGIKKDTFIDLIDDLRAPTIVMESLTDGKSIVVITDKMDEDRNPILISMKLNGRGQYKLRHLDSNYITSVYGKDRFVNFIRRCQKQKKILYIDHKKIQGLECFASLQLAGNCSNLESINRLKEQCHFVKPPVNVGIRATIKANKEKAATKKPVKPSKEHAIGEDR